MNTSGGYVVTCIQLFNCDYEEGIERIEIRRERHFRSQLSMFASHVWESSIVELGTKWR